MTDTAKTTDLVARLRDPLWRGPAQHLRGWDELDRLHDAAASEIERLRAALRIIAGEMPASDNLLGNADIARIALHG